MAEILVIGGGAAGMMAAIHAARAGASVTVLEHNEKLGKKLYITGKGRCNVTNDCTQDEFLAQVSRNPRFLYSALSYFAPRDMMVLLQNAGCPTVTQRGRRVFPATEKASDVTRTLTGLLHSLGVRIRLNTQAVSLLFSENGIAGVRLQSGETLSADAVIIATGGKSYPATGSTGDGWRLAAEAGHTVLPASPVLSAIESASDWPKELQGLSLKNVTLTLSRGKKILYSELGEMLFTHFGYSGPLILEASCHLPDPVSDASLSLDLKPGLTRDQLDARLRRDFETAGKKQLKNVLPALLPVRLAELFPSLCGLSPELICNQITVVQREALLTALKSLSLPLKGLRPLSEAIVTRGGVTVREVNPGTMESKLCPGLFFAGELLDVDAHTGGYNLQIAFSTGALAGDSAARRGI